jgi:hypothetical protein
MMLGKSKKMLIVLLVAGMLVFGLAIAVYADIIEPGSKEDPLATKSYVDSQLAKLSGQGIQWQVADLLTGQQLIAEAGTELILRAGKAVVVDPTGNGIPDLTAGTNILAGKGLSLNHHALVPRADGRGIRATEKAVVMYKGGISVK